jgi:hypothetical protein
MYLVYFSHVEMLEIFSSAPGRVVIYLCLLISAFCLKLFVQCDFIV